MLVGFMLAIGSLADVQAAEQPLLAILAGRLGDRLMPLVMGVVLVSIFACAVASMAATSRLIFRWRATGCFPARACSPR